MTDTDYKLAFKKMTVARKAPEEQQVRDLFMTPNYAIDLLIPFIPKEIPFVWEPACGTGKISGQLRKSGYTVFESDIKHDNPEQQVNFLTGELRHLPEKISIITNPPFSVKDLFIERCFEYGVPFAMLINADYSQKTIDWIKRGCEKIIPTARIAYITPNILKRIHEGEVWKLVENDYPTHTLKSIKEDGTDVWNWILEKDEFKEVHNYKSIDETPMNFLYEYSSAQFHSMWLTWKFNLGQSETFVDLPIEQRRYNI